MSTMGYVTTLTGAEDSASLSLDFEKQSYRIVENGKLVNKSFSDLITFSRASRAGRFNEQGKYELMEVNQPRFDYNPVTKVLNGLFVEETRTNLVTYSDTFTSTSWVKTAGNIDLVGSSPMGKAYKFIPTSTVAAHFLQKTYNAQAAGTYTVTRVVKAGELTKIRAQLFGTATAIAVGDFDLIAGTVTGVTVGSAKITPIGDGWFSCSVTGNLTEVGNFTDRWYPMKGLETSFAGNGVEGYFVACAQLELGNSPTSYIPSSETFTSRASTATYFDSNGVLRTAPVDVARSSSYIYDQSNKLTPVGLLLEATGATNLIRLSTDLSLSPWVRTAASASLTEGGMAPDGSVAQKFTMYGTTGHNINQTLSAALTVGNTYTLSMWLKSPNWGTKQFQMAYYDGGTLANGAVVVVSPEWKRYEYTFSPTAVAAAPQIRLVGFGNGVEGDTVEIFGVQLEVGSSASTYIPTGAAFTGRASTATYLDSKGLLQTAASGVARSESYKYDSNGVLRANGLLIEGSSSNLLTNSEDYSNTNWTINGPGTLPLTVTPSAGDGPRGPATMTLYKRADLGIKYMQKTFTVPAGNATFSQYVKVSGPLSKFYVVRGQTSGGGRLDARFDLTTGTTWVSVSGDVTAPKVYMENMGGGLWRCVATGVSTTNWTSFLFCPMDRSTGLDATSLELTEFYVDCAQVESSPFSSSYIPTGATQVARAADVFTTAQATRAADVSSSSAATRAYDSPYMADVSWYKTTEGTTDVTFVPGASGTGGTSVGFYMRSAAVIGNDVVASRINLSGTAACVVTDSAGAAVVSINAPGNYPPGTRVRAVTALKKDNFAFSVNGSVSVIDSSGNMPLPQQLRIGNNGSNSQNANGYICKFNYYPVRLANSQIETLSN